MIVNLIAARSRNNVIGKDGKIPWRLKGEQQEFKELTMGNAVIMGRNTFMEIGRPLPGRLNIVVTSRKLPSMIVDQTAPIGLLRTNPLTSALDLVKNIVNMDVYLAGGERIYEEALKKGLVDRIYLTDVDMFVEEDDETAFFPKFNASLFTRLNPEVVEGEIPYTRTVYVKKDSIYKFYPD